MARPLRPNIPGGVYHAMARGNERKPIFFDDEDREYFVDLLAKTTRRCRWECLAYCLMANHYHVVVRTPLPNLSRGMRLINGGYASHVNRRHERVGHLFQGRFRTVLIRGSDHLRIVMKYVLRNPVVAGLCATPADWRWSSYQATLGGEPASFVASAAALAWFGDDHHARDQFAVFIDDHNPIVTESMMTAEVEFPSVAVVPSTPRPSVEQVLALHPGGAGIAVAYHEHNYSLAEIAEVLGRSRPAVGRALVAYESELMLASGT